MCLELLHCAGGDLAAYMRARATAGPGHLRLSGPEAVEIFTQVAKAVGFAHSRGVVHRDIKLENVLMADGPTVHMYLTDFGLSELPRSEDSDRPSGPVGSLYYLPPEALGAAPGGKGLAPSTAADAWCLGIMLYAMLVGHLPFRSASVLAAAQRAQSEPSAWHAWTSDAWYDPLTQFSADCLRILRPATIVEEVKQAIRECKVRIPSHVSAGAACLLQELLHKDPAQRLRASAIVAHPWIQAARTPAGLAPLPMPRPQAQAPRGRTSSTTSRVSTTTHANRCTELDADASTPSHGSDRSINSYATVDARVEAPPRMAGRAGPPELDLSRLPPSRATRSSSEASTGASGRAADIPASPAPCRPSVGCIDEVDGHLDAGSMPTRGAAAAALPPRPRSITFAPVPSPATSASSAAASPVSTPRTPGISIIAEPLQQTLTFRRGSASIPVLNATGARHRESTMAGPDRIEENASERV